MAKTLELCNHTKPFLKKKKLQIPHLREKKKYVLDSILRPIFDYQNVGSKFGPWNTKLFSIELAFWIFSNHSIPMLESNVMTETLKLHNHIKPCKNVNPTWRWKPYHFPFFAYIKSLMPPFVSIHPRVC